MSREMRIIRLKVVSMLLAAITLLFLGCSEPAPDFFDSSGKGYKYAELKNKWLVINYWATWCTPCIAEIPELNSFASEIEEAMVIGVNYDGVQGEELQKQVSRMGIEFPVFVEDPGKKLGLPRPDVLPTTYLIAPGNEIRIVMLVGPQTRDSLKNAMVPP